MKDFIAGSFIGVIVGILLGAIPAHTITGPCYRRAGEIHVYSEAIKAGAAIRAVDQETGETRIQWRCCDGSE